MIFRLLALGVLLAAGFFTSGCGDSRELAYKDVEIAELRRQIKELEGMLAASQHGEVKRDIEAGKKTDEIIKSDPNIVNYDDSDVNFVKFTLVNDVFFSSGKAELSLAAKSTLNKVVAVIKEKYGTNKLRIEGHTDSDPIKRSKWASNQALSEARADAVRDYLVERGLASARVTTKGWADTKPLGKEKSKNRRVEFFILKK